MKDIGKRGSLISCGPESLRCIPGDSGLRGEIVGRRMRHLSGTASYVRMSTANAVEYNVINECVSLFSDGKMTVQLGGEVLGRPVVTVREVSGRFTPRRVDLDQGGQDMDFLNLLAVVRRHRLLMAAGVVLGITLLFLMRYSVAIYPGVGLRITERSLSNYTVESQLIVVDPRFGVGRTASLGTAAAPDMFNKTIDLAATYANLLSSGFSVAAAEKAVGPIDAEVQAEGVRGAPIIELTVTGTDSDRIIRFSTALSNALQNYLVTEQRARGIDEAERASVEVLSPPTISAVQSREWEMALLAFLTPVLVAYALAILMDRASRAGDEE